MEEEVDDRFAGIDIDTLLSNVESRKRNSKRISRHLYEAPEFVHRLCGEETVMEGQSLCLECKVIGFPVPTLRWFKDSEEIIDHPRISVESDGTGCYALTIRRVNKGDEAAYRCRAENIEGCSSCVFFLSVRCKPKSARKRGSRSNAKKRNVSFPPMFSTIVEKVEEEEKEGRELETLPPSPLTQFYYALTLKGRQSWPSFVGDWAYVDVLIDDDDDDDDDDNDDGGDEDKDNISRRDQNGFADESERSPSHGRMLARRNFRRRERDLRSEAKKRRLEEEEEERKKKEEEEKAKVEEERKIREAEERDRLEQIKKEEEEVERERKKQRDKEEEARRREEAIRQRRLKRQQKKEEEEEKRRKEEEEQKREEELRRQEEEKRRTEELRLEEERIRKEELLKEEERKREEERKIEEEERRIKELQKQEEERREEEERKMAEDKKKKEERRKEEERIRAEEKRIEEERRKEEENRKVEEKRKEEERRKREEQLKLEAKRLEDEKQKLKLDKEKIEEAKKKEEEFRKQEQKKKEEERKLYEAKRIEEQKRLREEEDMERKRLAEQRKKEEERLKLDKEERIKRDLKSTGMSKAKFLFEDKSKMGQDTENKSLLHSEALSSKSKAAVQKNVLHKFAKCMDAQEKPNLPGKSSTPGPSKSVKDKFASILAQKEQEEATKREREEKIRKDQEEKRRKEKEAKDRVEREEKERKEREDKEKKEKKEKEERERREKEDREKREKLEKEKREREAREQKEQEESERREREGKARQEREESERKEREDKERREREGKERKEREENEIREREERERKERDEKARQERIEKERVEREAKEREEQEQKEREKMEREIKERKKREESVKRERELKEKRETEDKAKHEREERERKENVQREKLERVENERKEREENERLKRDENGRRIKEEEEEKRRKEKEILKQKQIQQRKELQLKEEEEKLKRKEKQDQQQKEERLKQMRKEKMRLEQLQRQFQEEKLKKGEREELRKKRILEEAEKKRQEDIKKAELQKEEFEVKIYKRDYTFTDLRKSLETRGGSCVIDEAEHKYWDDILEKHDYSISDLKKSLDMTSSLTLGRPSRCRARRNSIEDDTSLQRMKRSGSLSDIKDAYTKSLDRPKKKSVSSESERIQKDEELLKRAMSISAIKQTFASFSNSIQSPNTSDKSLLSPVDTSSSSTALTISKTNTALRTHAELSNLSVDVKAKRRSFHEIISHVQSDSKSIRDHAKKRASVHYGSFDIPRYERLSSWSDNTDYTVTDSGSGVVTSSTSSSSSSSSRVPSNGRPDTKSASDMTRGDGNDVDDSGNKVRPFVYNSIRTIARNSAGEVCNGNDIEDDDNDDDDVFEEPSKIPRLEESNPFFSTTSVTEAITHSNNNSNTTTTTTTTTSNNNNNNSNTTTTTTNNNNTTTTTTSSSSNNNNSNNNTTTTNNNNNNNSNNSNTTTTTNTNSSSNNNNESQNTKNATSIFANASTDSLSTHDISKNDISNSQSANSSNDNNVKKSNELSNSAVSKSAETETNKNNKDKNKILRVCLHNSSRDAKNNEQSFSDVPTSPSIYLETIHSDEADNHEYDVLTDRDTQEKYTTPNNKLSSMKTNAPFGDCSDSESELEFSEIEKNVAAVQESNGGFLCENIESKGSSPSSSSSSALRHQNQSNGRHQNKSDHGDRSFFLAVPSKDSRGRAARMPREKTEFIKGDLEGLRPPRESTPIFFDSSSSESGESSSEELESPTEPPKTLFLSDPRQHLDNLTHNQHHQMIGVPATTLKHTKQTHDVKHTNQPTTDSAHFSKPPHNNDSSRFKVKKVEEPEKEDTSEQSVSDKSCLGNSKSDSFIKEKHNIADGNNKYRSQTTTENTQPDTNGHQNYRIIKDTTKHIDSSLSTSEKVEKDVLEIKENNNKLQSKQANLHLENKIPKSDDSNRLIKNNSQNTLSKSIEDNETHNTSFRHDVLHQPFHPNAIDSLVNQENKESFDNTKINLKPTNLPKVKGVEFSNKVQTKQHQQGIKDSTTKPPTTTPTVTLSPTSTVASTLKPLLTSKPSTSKTPASRRSNASNVPLPSCLVQSQTNPPDMSHPTTLCASTALRPNMSTPSTRSSSYHSEHSGPTQTQPTPPKPSPSSHQDSNEKRLNQLSHQNKNDNVPPLETKAADIESSTNSDLNRPTQQIIISTPSKDKERLVTQLSQTENINMNIPPLDTKLPPCKSAPYTLIQKTKVTSMASSPETHNTKPQQQPPYNIELSWDLHLKQNSTNASKVAVKSQQNIPPPKPSIRPALDVGKSKPNLVQIPTSQTSEQPSQNDNLNYDNLSNKEKSSKEVNTPPLTTKGLFKKPNIFSNFNLSLGSKTKGSPNKEAKTEQKQKDKINGFESEQPGSKSKTIIHSDNSKSKKDRETPHKINDEAISKQNSVQGGLEMKHTVRKILSTRPQNSPQRMDNKSHDICLLKDPTSSGSDNKSNCKDVVICGGTGVGKPKQPRTSLSLQSSSSSTSSSSSSSRARRRVKKNQITQCSPFGPYTLEGVTADNTQRWCECGIPERVEMTHDDLIIENL